MAEAELPRAKLRALVGRRASGELICVGEATEVHVYLQSGRVAWATASSQPFAFTRHLRKHADISTETFQSVLEECRRGRLPLGETLVEWQLATYEQVRAALHHQIEGALALLSDLPSGQCVFLERAREYAHYKTDLTFVLEDFATPNSAPSDTASDDAEANDAGARLVEQLRSANEFEWVELLEGSRVLASAPKDESARRVPPGLLEHTLLDGGTFAALRVLDGSIVGVRLATKARTLWCRVDDEAGFGAAVSTLAVLAQEPARATRATSTRGAPSSFGEGDELGLCRDFMSRAADVLALAVCRTGAEPTVGVLRDGISRAFVAELIAHRMPALACDVVREAPKSRRMSLGDIGPRLKSLVSGQESAWLFATEMPCPEPATLWMLVDRASPQGLGWAYLTSMTRQLGRAGAAR